MTRVTAAYGWDANEMGQMALEGIESTWLDPHPIGRRSPGNSKVSSPPSDRPELAAALSLLAPPT